MMARGLNVYRIVCDAADTAAGVRALEPWAWADLHGYLLANLSENGITGQILALMLVEGAARYAALAVGGTSNIERPTSNIEGGGEEA